MPVSEAENHSYYYAYNNSMWIFSFRVLMGMVLLMGKSWGSQIFGPLSYNTNVQYTVHVGAR